MGVYAGPEISNDGLVLALDAGNSKGFDAYENLISHSASTSGIVLGVIGSGGSLPTGWGIDQGQPGTTLEVVGYGIEEGLNYIDLKFSGTTSTTNRWLVRPGNTVSLTSGVTYNSSLYAKTISGTPTDFRQFSVFGGGSGANLSGINSTLTRYSGSSAAGSTGTFFPRLDIGYNSIGTVMNFTIRVAGFQVEVGSSVSPYYPTTGTTKTRGTTWTDLSGRGNTGALTNGPTYNSSNGGSIVFDGTDDNIQLSNASNFISSSQSSITINFWVKTNVTGVYKKIFITGTTGTSSVSGTYFSIGPSPYQVYFGIITNNGTQQAIYTTNLSTTQYSNLCGTYDGSNIRLYLNGTQVAIQSQTGNIVNTGIARISGYDNNTEVWNGNISTAQIYNRALTAAEVSQNFNATRGRYGV
jgi:hypothetical protein